MKWSGNAVQCEMLIRIIVRIWLFLQHDVAIEILTSTIKSAEFHLK